MPKNKRESLIFTVMMCLTMVLWMSIYNVSLQMHSLSLNSVAAAWMGFPVAYIFAMCCDWFFVSMLTKAFAFRFLVNEKSSPLKIVIALSSCMVIGMVILMSFYGAVEGCFHTGNWQNIGMMWLVNIPKNFIMALPFQLLIAGPLIRYLFRKGFPEGSIA